MITGSLATPMGSPLPETLGVRLPIVQAPIGSLSTPELAAAVSEAGGLGTLADEGADVIVAQGWEAGGHVRGEIATMALVPAVVDEVEPTPVIAAGGIADGRGLAAAALALGAQAGRLGSRFIASAEAGDPPRLPSGRRLRFRGAHRLQRVLRRRLPNTY